MTADAPESAPAVLDAGLIPLGEHSLRSIIRHVTAVGDEAETTYLEVKSSLDPGSKSGVAKVAKFLLGAANRRPHEASRHFHGYAVLVVGAQKGGAPGVPRGVEPHEMEDRLRPYLGPQFPAFELQRIGVDSENEVLFFIAPPPQEGQSIFPCYKTFQGQGGSDSLEDGAIYVRGASNTRRARSGEVLALVERARGGGRPSMELKVTVVGPISRVVRVDEVLERLYGIAEDHFSEREVPAQNDFATTSALLARSILGGTVPLPEENRQEALDKWRQKLPEHLARGREHILGAALPGVGIRVVSRDRFVAKPHLILTFHDCEVLDYLDIQDAEYSRVVAPVLRMEYPFMVEVARQRRLYSYDYPVTWTNRGDDAEIVIKPDSFRPNVSWTSDQDDYVLLARDPEARFLTVSWILTEDGNDAQTSGELRVLTAELDDAADLFEEVFSGDD